MVSCCISVFVNTCMRALLWNYKLANKYTRYWLKIQRGERTCYIMLDYYGIYWKPILKGFLKNIFLKLTYTD